MIRNRLAVACAFLFLVGPPRLPAQRTQPQLPPGLQRSSAVDRENWLRGWRDGYNRKARGSTRPIEKPPYKRVYDAFTTNYNKQFAWGLYDQGYGAGESQRTVDARHEEEERQERERREAAERAAKARQAAQELEAAQARQAEQRRAELRRTLATEYGNMDRVQAWEEGFAAAERGDDADPPDYTDPHKYLAYHDGYSAARRDRAAEQGISLPAGDPAEQAKLLSEQYVKQLDAMNLLAEQEYLLNAAIADDFRFLSENELTPELIVEATRLCLGRAREAYRIHLRFRNHTVLASEIQLLLIKALEALAHETLVKTQELTKAEFKTHMYADADLIAAQARRFAREPVLLPAAFDEMTRYQSEFIVVLSSSLEISEIRGTLAQEFLPSALLAGMKKFLQLSQEWQQAHLDEWRQTRLKRLYPDGNAPPRDPRQQAREAIREFLKSPWDTILGLIDSEPGARIATESRAASEASRNAQVTLVHVPPRPETDSGGFGLLGNLVGTAVFLVLGLVAVLLIHPVLVVLRHAARILFGSS